MLQSYPANASKPLLRAPHSGQTPDLWGYGIAFSCVAKRIAFSVGCPLLTFKFYEIAVYKVFTIVSTERMPKHRSIPAYVPAVDFFKNLGIYYVLGQQLIGRGILRPDATLNAKPIFRADAATVEKAKTAIADYRATQNRARINLQELSHV
jgi:hypothetical protein